MKIHNDADTQFVTVQMDTNDHLEGVAVMPRQVFDDMRDEIAEQARLLGMSGSREAALLSRIAELDKEIAALKSLLREAYGYTTAAGDLLPERIKAVLKEEG